MTLANWKNWKFIVLMALVGTVLTSIVTIHQKWQYIKSDILYPAFRDLVEETIEHIAPKMVHKQVTQEKMANKTGTRAEVSEYSGNKIAKEDVTKKIAQGLLFIDTLRDDKKAFEDYMTVLSDILWNQMPDTVFAGIPFKHHNGIFYFRFRGVIFDCYYKPRNRAYYLKTSYGQEIRIRLAMVQQ